MVCLVSVSLADDENSRQLWLDFDDHFYLSERWEFFGDTGYRAQVDDGTWKKLYARPSLRHHHRNYPLEGRFGLGVFWTYNEDSANQIELRPWGGVLFKWPKISILRFSHYVRLEDRIQWTTEDWDKETSFRLRYKLSTKIPLAREASEKYFFVPLSMEWFTDAEGHINERYSTDTRFDVGLGYIFSWVWVIEGHFIVQSSRASDDTTFDTSDYIVRVQLKRLWAAHDFMTQE